MTDEKDIAAKCFEYVEKIMTKRSYEKLFENMNKGRCIVVGSFILDIIYNINITEKKGRSHIYILSFLDDQGYPTIYENNNCISEDRCYTFEKNIDIGIDVDIDQMQNGTQFDNIMEGKERYSMFMNKPPLILTNDIGCIKKKNDVINKLFPYTILQNYLYVENGISKIYIYNKNDILFKETTKRDEFIAGTTQYLISRYLKSNYGVKLREKR